MLSQVEEAFPHLLQLVNQRFPHVTVELTLATSGFEFVEKALALGAAATPPDFSYANARFVPAMVEANLLQDVNSIVTRERIDLAGVAKPVLEDLSWKGMLASLPLDIGHAFIQANLALFQGAGRPDPVQLWQDNRWHWDTFVEAAIAMARVPAGEQEYVPYVLRTWEGDYLSIIRSLGGDVLNKDRTRFVLDDSAGVAALTQWAELATRYRVSPLPDREPPGGFNAGRVAMYAGHPGVIKPVRKALGDASATWRWDIVPHPAPAGKQPVPTLFSNGFHLWRGTKHAATTVEVTKLLVSSEMMLEWGGQTGREPARTPLVPEYARRLDIPAQDPRSYVKVSQALADKVRGLPLTPQYVEWHKILVDEVLRPVAAGEKGAQDALHAAGPAINAILTRK
jgi:ABC-type glycerol-3-phosphate transport system substrate-binding protein